MAGTLTAMPDERSDDAAAKAEARTTGDAHTAAAPATDRSDGNSGGIFTGYGVASALLGLVAVVAVVLATLIYVGHRNDADERDHEVRAMQAAADWTGVLINMNAGNVTSSVQKLHDGTVGQLNADFESTVAPFTQLVQKLQSKTAGQIDSVAVESLHHPQPGEEGKPQVQPELAAVASSTTTVLVLATSVSQNVADNKPQTVRWRLRLGVSDVDGKLLISRLETLR
ncbi:hypothetical protein [Mycobacterium sp. OTB74]|uniref:hypothetical protein n=1 Tax=Mycobacterium sp. OTB74 TaxID=1853452 RepID=UPI002475529C|nr:hypothetical protein [Mycobacterium sp. OTB74]MDH6243433.1 succinyl-CoA synthetase beta subunit [Mycobacterium sp. OTB74]